MKPSIAALAIVLTATAATAAPALAMQAAAPAAGDASEPKPSPKAGPAILALQTAINANDTANIPAKLAAAQAAASTPADRYWIARMQLNAAIKANDAAAEQQAVDAIAASGLAPAATILHMQTGVGSELLKAKQYDQAVAAFQKAAVLAPNDPDIQLSIAQARSDQGRKDDAAAAIQKAIAISKASGQKPSEDMYRNATALAYEAKLPSSVAIAREWLAAYPGNTSWKDSIAIYRNLRGGDPENVIDVMRLARLTSAMQTANDYAAYAYKAIEQANFGEAKSVLDAGIAAGALKTSEADTAQMLAATGGKIPTAADLAAAEKGAVAPQAFLRVGDRYYAAGNYSKAAALYRQAMAKGVDANLANLRLGEALVGSGDNAGATTAFNTVKGSLSDLAQFWLIYAQHHG